MEGGTCMLKQLNNDQLSRLKRIYKRSSMYLISIIALFLFIGGLTTIKPAYRFSSELITKWTSDIDGATFLYLLSMENRGFKEAYPKDIMIPKLSTIFFQITTNIKPNDPRSLLGQELPGFSHFGNEIIIAGEGTNYMNLSYESSPPLEAVLKDREAVLKESTKEKDSDETKPTPEKSTNGKEVVFIYNTHNRESFLPHLPDVTDPNSAHHAEVNVGKVSEYLSEALGEYGIGSFVDNTDHMSVLNQNDWGYGQSYRASREVVTAAAANNKDLQYLIDVHRDSVPRDVTTKEIDGEAHAKILFVVGAEYNNYEENLSLATKLNQLVEDKYPGLSRGVIKKEGPGSDGVYNQDLLESSLLIEFGGYDNTLEELYRTADIIAEVFSEYYWDAEKVDGEQ